MEGIYMFIEKVKSMTGNCQEIGCLKEKFIGTSHQITVFQKWSDLLRSQPQDKLEKEPWTYWKVISCKLLIRHLHGRCTIQNSTYYWSTTPPLTRENANSPCIMKMCLKARTSHEHSVGIIHNKADSSMRLWSPLC